MVDFQLTDQEYDKFKEIYDAIKSNDLTGVEIMEIIEYHPNLHIGSDISHDIIKIMFYAIQFNKPCIVKYINKSLHQHIDFSIIVYLFLMHHIDNLSLIELCLSYMNINDQSAKKAIAVVIQVLKYDNPECLDIFIKDGSVFNTLSSKDIHNIFHTFTSNFMRTPHITNQWKIILSNFPQIDKMMMELAVKDEELFIIFYPDLAEIFII